MAEENSSALFQASPNHYRWDSMAHVLFRTTLNTHNTISVRKSVFRQQLQSVNQSRWPTPNPQKNL